MTWKKEYNHQRSIYLLQKQRERRQKQRNDNLNQYYQANSIKILLSLKDYTELNKDKHKHWLSFAWTLQELADKGINDIIQIMKINEQADKLIKDYWITAKSQANKHNKTHWNSLSEQQQHHLIKYWASEKARRENNLLTILEEQEQHVKHYEKDIELAKFHEERGKIKCVCYACSAEKEQIKTETIIEKEQCSDCDKWVKQLAEDHDICFKYLKNYEE